MLRVLLESPFGGDTAADVALNIAYARLAVRDCLVNHNEAPFASHLLYPQPHILDDRNEDDRKLGIYAGLQWGYGCEVSVFYTDLGMSNGMRIGYKSAVNAGRSCDFRVLPTQLWEQFAMFRASFNGGDNVRVFA